MDVRSCLERRFPHEVVRRSSRLLAEEWLISGVDCVLELVIS